VTFQKAIQYYLEKHAYGNAETNDLLVAFHEVSGMSLDWFWHQWLYQGGEPEYAVSYRSIVENQKTFTEFEILQTHQRNDVVGLFKMPVWFEVHYNDGTYSRAQHWVSNEKEIVRIQNLENKKIAYALFDADNALLKKLNFKKEVPELLAQAQKATNIMCRYDAIVALKNTPYNLKAKTYESIY